MLLLFLFVLLLFFVGFFVFFFIFYFYFYFFFRDSSMSFVGTVEFRYYVAIIMLVNLGKS